ncbi:hypothetical protein [Pseudomonas phage PA1C]|uniref:Uncharacterized protein n=1 Tax=Pseudomonas phage vB_PaeM_PS119XW TaxID=2601632 RepID=A0A5C1K762_9CAUD|nr:hypothetical protein PP933_gp218 [Pseudomonas phage vB_PaeM_PS119XW]QBX32374.1 hypothetical protein [Pseudomonas phage PA1C]QEM41947.1 hypothetical protein [Pseudomonas phage vB_PaeM_PS119XW]
MKEQNIDHNKPYTYVVSDSEGNMRVLTTLGDELQVQIDYAVGTGGKAKVEHIEEGIRGLCHSSTSTRLLRATVPGFYKMLEGIMGKIGRAMAEPENWTTGNNGRLAFHIETLFGADKKFWPLITQSVYERLQYDGYVSVDVQVAEDEEQPIKLVTRFGIPARMV